MLTVCWAAKGGSGTTVTAAGLALAHPSPALLVDLTAELACALGGAPPPGPGLADWLASEAPAARLGGLEHALGHGLALLPRGRPGAIRGAPRWPELARHLARDPRRVIVDAGTGPPPPALAAAHQRLLVVRNCYLNLRAAAAGDHTVTPTGCVLVEEPGRRLRADHVEDALGVPVVAVVLADPAIARAVDAGLLLGRVPSGLRRPLAGLAAPTATAAAA